MSNHIQLEFFRDDDLCRLESELKRAKESQDRVRRGMFARLNKLQSQYDELRLEHEAFKRAICKGERGER